MEMRSCIYCKKLKRYSTRDDEPSDFNKEHVIPSSLGTFEPESMTLIGVVCQACNSLFSRQIETPFLRQSIEGLQRHDADMQIARIGKNSDGTPSTLGRRGSLAGHVRDFHPEIDGAIVEWTDPDEGSDDPSMLFLPEQIGLGPADEGPFQWFRLRNVPDREAARALGMGSPVYIRMLCDEEKARSALGERGYQLPEGATAQEVPFSAGQPLPVRISGALTELHFRMAAKIAFNYFAYHYPDFVRLPYFDRVREYILDGSPKSELLEVPETRVVTPSTGKILGNVPENIRIYSHVVTVVWNPKGRVITGMVSLFGWFRYDVQLSERMELEWKPVGSAHIFHPHSRRIEALMASTDPRSRDLPEVDFSKHRRARGMFVPDP